MSRSTTIQVDKRIVQELKKAKEYPEQAYNTLLEKMIRLYKSAKQRNQYDRFLHEIQKRKMQELWDNKEDEAWEDA